MSRLLEIEKASLFIPGDSRRKLALRDLSWNMDEGGHSALLGPNGAGKSTLLRLMAGELWLCAGSISWLPRGKRETSPIAARSMTRLVSPMLQEYCQRNAWNISLENMLLGAFDNAPLSYGLNERPARSEADSIKEIMDELGAMDWLSLRLPELSQGQLRLALLARALLARPKLLLLDECADGLDKEHKRLFLGLLEKRRHESTMVFAAHRADAIPDWVENRVWIREGRLYFNVPETPAPPRPEIPAPKAVRQPAGPTIFSLENVSTYLDRHLVLRNIDWSVREGEVWRLSGPNGAGKSTLLRLLAGDEFAAAGGALSRFSPFLGRSPETLEEIRRSVRLVSDLGQALYGYPLNGLELVCSGFDNSIGLHREISGAEKEEAMAALELFFRDGSAGEIAGESIRRLSSGQLRKLYLARALMGEPDLLLLDEPCSGLDGQARTEYLALLARLAAKGPGGRPLSLVFVSHYEEDGPEAGFRKAYLDRGRLSIIH